MSLYPFLGLPDEVIIHALLFLDESEILENVALVSRQLLQTTHNEYIWQILAQRRYENSANTLPSRFQGLSLMAIYELYSSWRSVFFSLPPLFEFFFEYKYSSVYRDSTSRSTKRVRLSVSSSGIVKYENISNTDTCYSDDGGFRRQTFSFGLTHPRFTNFRRLVSSHVLRLHPSVTNTKTRTQEPNGTRVSELLRIEGQTYDRSTQAIRRLQREATTSLQTTYEELHVIRFDLVTKSRPSPPTASSGNRVRGTMRPAKWRIGIVMRSNHLMSRACIMNHSHSFPNGSRIRSKQNPEGFKSLFVSGESTGREGVRVVVKVNFVGQRERERPWEEEVFLSRVMAQKVVRKQIRLSEQNAMLWLPWVALRCVGEG